MLHFPTINNKFANLLKACCWFSALQHHDGSFSFSFFNDTTNEYHELGLYRHTTECTLMQNIEAWNRHPSLIQWQILRHWWSTWGYELCFFLQWNFVHYCTDANCKVVEVVEFIYMISNTQMRRIFHLPLQSQCRAVSSWTIRICSLLP